MSTKEPWHQNTAFLVFALLMLGPLGLPLVWANRRFSVFLKIAVTVIVITLAALTLHLCASLYTRLQSQLAELKAALRAS